MILSRLSEDRRALQEQTLAYGAHLRRQYMDRCIYWQARASSRLKGLSRNILTICMIIDSIDHQKLRWPRALCLQSKDFNNFVRPHLTCTGVLVHGYFSLLAVSEQWIPADSSRTCEIIAHACHRLVEDHGVDLRNVNLLLQSDNCSKEGKNNCMLGWSAAQVATRRVHSISQQYLQSGHSHEDVDQWFSLLTSYIQQHQHVSSPEAFVTLLEGFLQDIGRRSTEPAAHVVKMDAVRNWPLVSYVAGFEESCHLS